jgi:hypothetical protein
MLTSVRRTVRAGLAVVAAAALLTTAPSGQAQLGGGPIVRIEQDWELVVNTPDTTLCSPQIFILMYPESGGDIWGQFLINYNDQPKFSAGGVQIQLWQNSSVLDGEDNAPRQAILQNANETVTFTLVMEIKGGKLNFNAQNVSSPSFGDINHLASSAAYDPNSFTNYKSSDSTGKSGILFGSNRVTSLTLKQVRKIDQAGNAIVEAPQLVYPSVAAAGVGGGGLIGQ